MQAAVRISSSDFGKTAPSNWTFSSGVTRVGECHFMSMRGLANCPSSMYHIIVSHLNPSPAYTVPSSKSLNDLSAQSLILSSPYLSVCLLPMQCHVSVFPLPPLPPSPHLSLTYPPSPMPSHLPSPPCHLTYPPSPMPPSTATGSVQGAVDAGVVAPAVILPVFAVAVAVTAITVPIWFVLKKSK